jgi:hypothetical protein
MFIFDGCDKLLALDEIIMNASPESSSSLAPVYLIMSCNTVEELSQKVSAALKDGTWCLQGQPFVFKDQVCQAVKRPDPADKLNFQACN